MTHWEAEELPRSTSGALMRPMRTEGTGLPWALECVCFFSFSGPCLNSHPNERCVWHSKRNGWLTGAGHRRGVRERPVVAVLAVAAPGALAVVEAVRRTARALKVLGRGLVETPAARCGRGTRRMRLRPGGKRRHSLFAPLSVYQTN